MCQACNAVKLLACMTEITAINTKCRCMVYIKRLNGIICFLPFLQSSTLISIYVRVIDLVIG